MSNTAIGLLGLCGLFILFVLRMPVGLSMLTAGVLGTVAIRGWSGALPSLSSETFAIASFYQLVRVALPEMKRLGYDDALATGTVASGGTMGFIFPPSAGLVIYGLLTEQAIGRFFLADVIPGIILTILFLITIQIVTARRTKAGPRGPRTGREERVAP